MNVRIFDSAGALVSAAARTILQRVTPDVPITIALSGGSTPKPLYDLLGSQHIDQLARTPITWVVVDERYVPPSDPQCNAAMIEKTLFANGLPSSHRFLRFDTQLGDPAVTARAFEEEWRTMELAQLDLVLLGCGDDGHTASLFPGTSALEVTNRIATEVYVPRLEQWRVTLTLPVIREAKTRLVLATGESKAPILRDIRAGVGHPIALATRERDSWFLVDRAAASQML